MQIKIDDADSWSPLPPQADWTYSYALADLDENTDADDSYHTIKIKITDIHDTGLGAYSNSSA